MSRLFVPAALVLAAVLPGIGLRSPLAHAADKPRTIGSFERLDPRFDALIPKDATIEVLADGFKWTEGPVWVKNGGYLLFSDIPNNVVVKWSEKEGRSEYLKPSGYTGKDKYQGYEPGSNGLAIDKAGNLLLCQHGDRRISRLTKDKTFETLAGKYDGKRFNSPNDLAIMKNGDVYFTDPPYGLPKTFKDPAKELPYQGVYRLKPNGEVTLLTKEMTSPNGLALTPDEKTLYVANSNPDIAIWKAFPVKEDGTLGEGKLLHDATADVKASPDKGLPDGLKIDQKGNIFATAVNGVYVFAPDGKLIGRIVTNDRTANCAFGDDGSTLYITANDKLVRVKTTTKGQGF